MRQGFIQLGGRLDTVWREIFAGAKVSRICWPSQDIFVVLNFAAAFILVLAKTCEDIFAVIIFAAAELSMKMLKFPAIWYHYSLKSTILSSYKPHNVIEGLRNRVA